MTATPAYIDFIKKSLDPSNINPDDFSEEAIDRAFDEFMGLPRKQRQQAIAHIVPKIRAALTEGDRVARNRAVAAMGGE
jgi:hypothetical protein